MADQEDFSEKKSSTAVEVLNVQNKNKKHSKLF